MEEESKYKLLGIFCGLLCIGGTILTSILFYMGVEYPIDRDTQAYLTRAQDTSNATLMSEYVQYCIDGYEKHDMDEGYWALVFTKPDNDMVLYIKSLESIKVRLDSIANTNMSTYDYAKNMEEIDQEIRDLRENDPNLWAYWNVQNSCIGLIILEFLTILLLISAISAYKLKDEYDCSWDIWFMLCIGAFIGLFVLHIYVIV